MSLAQTPTMDTAAHQPVTSVVEPAARVAVPRGRLRVWGWQSALSLLDQGLTSGAGFGVNVLLARWMHAEAYGAFAVAYAGYLFVSGFHNVLVVEPLSVLGPSRHAEELPAYFRTQVAVHAFLVGTLSAAALVIGLALWWFMPSSPMVGAVLGGGLALPFLLLLWLTRRMCYVVQRPSVAVLGSGIYPLLVLGGLLALEYLHVLSPFTAFALMSASSCLAAVPLLWKLGLAKEGWGRSSGISCRRVFRENWSYGNWLTLTTVLSWFSVQAQIFLAASLLGLTSAGILRAIQLPALAMSQVIAASMQIILPSLSRELGRGDFHRLHRKTVLTSAFLTIVGMLFVLSLILFSSQAEHLFYGGKYRTYARLLPVLGLAPVFTGFSASFSCALRALGKSRYELLAYVLSALTALVTSVVLMPRWGLPGGVASVVSSTAVLAAAVYFSYCRWGIVGRLQASSGLVGIEREK